MRILAEIIDFLSTFTRFVWLDANGGILLAQALPLGNVRSIWCCPLRREWIEPNTER